MRRINKEDKLLIFGLILILIVGFLVFYPVGYYRISPGVAKTLAPMVKVKAKKHPIEGEVMLTAVSMREARLFDYIYIKLFKPKFIELRPKPQGIDMNEYAELMLEMMKESQLKATAVALKEAGYNPEITGKGVKIVKVLEEGDAYGKLKDGDIIVAVDDTPVQLLTDTIKKIQNREVGQEVKITVIRNGKKEDYQLRTLALQENSDNPSIGVFVAPYKREYKFPINISINAGKIGGPSAGSMFTLEIFNRLTKEDITHGLKVAGTGTIDLDGSIGRIDGIQQKIVAAKKKGAKIFFAPKGNSDKAKQMKDYGIDIVIVDNVEDIISYLENLKG
ncbi:PDZ domain-containing protein [Orenia marismortui]|uniref:endopeptidase La n=1 Tax=Orenia marismortui TaxID=46469 RepID=A0A4R8GZD7_9FIRM|nr:PDZ domain-containing protein [Orenia marismortui]TDX52107.1 PDZ domain-containing protein [Orenia marismortui]